MRYWKTLLLLLQFGFAMGQDPADSLQEAHRGTVFGLPILYNTPETSWAFGLAGIYSFYTDRPAPRAATLPSQLQLAAAYTLNRQLFFFMPYDIFTPHNAFRFNGELGFYRYTYFYYGIGNEYEEFPGELFSVTFPRIRINALKRTGGKLYAGLRFWLDDFQITETASEGLLANGNIPGAEGGLVSGVGPMLQLDSRDQLFYPHRGELLEAALLFNSKWLGSDFAYTKFTFNGSKYLPLSARTVLALNTYVELNSGQPPFYQLAQLGGGRKLRGYYEGRYRDNNLLILQAEWRFPVWKRLKAAVFGGAGLVAATPAAFSHEHLRPAIGGGLRYLVLQEQQIHVRLDLAWGQNSSGFYLTVGEAF